MYVFFGFVLSCLLLLFPSLFSRVYISKKILDSAEHTTCPWLDQAEAKGNSNKNNSNSGKNVKSDSEEKDNSGKGNSNNSNDNKKDD